MTSGVDVELPDIRLSRQVEAADYYLCDGALTDVAKYAHATTVRVSIRAKEDTLVVEVSDNGIGGAEFGAGTGLLGLPATGRGLLALRCP